MLLATTVTRHTAHCTLPVYGTGELLDICISNGISDGTTGSVASEQLTLSSLTDTVPERLGGVVELCRAGVDRPGVGLGPGIVEVNV